ncbi:MAG: hypothetical protein JWL60_1071 [Gemmatimonadetes bacterium]|jgi:hypothetical protein|nr:hypothetical protein [Gemmatimonadota bacterium]
MTRSGSTLLRLAALCAGLAVPRAVDAQEFTTLVGIVRDSTGRPVADVELRLNGGDVRARTSDAGGFRIAAAPVGFTRVGVRRLGFAPSLLDVNLRAGRIDSLVVTLTALAAVLPGVTIADEHESYSRKVLAGFWERRSRGFGHFLTRDEIAQRNASTFADLLRRLPNISVLSVNGRQTVRLKRVMGGRDCPPQYFVDGMRLEAASPEEFVPQDVEALEVYSGPATTPAQFAPRPFTYTCGAIVIWTRLPGT